MAKQLQYRRLLLLGLLLLAAFAGLGYRLVDLQVLRHDELQKRAQDLTKHIYHLQPRRGDILDIRGNLLATSVFVKTVCADPTLITNRWAEVAHALAPLLQTNETELAQKLTPRTRKNNTGEILPVQYVVLKRKVSVETWEKIRATMEQLSFGVDEKHLPRKEQAVYDNLRTKAIFADPVDDQLRNYPNQSLAAHVLGYLRDDTGVDGVERELDDKLKGVAGWRVSERDRHQREIVSMREEDVEPHDGLNAVLTIDSGVQHIVEEALADGMEKCSPVSISGIVIRPRTGEILALATLPTFDPNNPGHVPAESVLHDRVITDCMDPGSTFKIVVVSGALNDHKVTLSDTFNCENGAFLFMGKVLHDHVRYGELTVEQIIAKSSNIGAAKIAMQRLGNDRFYEYIRNFGFGSPTGITLPGEIHGIVNDVKNWKGVTVARIPMGQGISVTPLQMAMAMSAVANGGVLMRPMIVDRLVDEDGSVVAKYSPQSVRRVIGEEADRQMIQALKLVATAEGTAPKAALDNYTVAGKTGTAEKPPYTDNKFYATFIGFFPADNPEICIYVAMDDPKGNLHQGGQICAPIFHQIAEKAANYLNIRPDRTVEAVAAPADARALKGGLAQSRMNP
jgi:cell division protein FtsI/penicillin-binding protein 2